MDKDQRIQQLLEANNRLVEAKRDLRYILQEVRPYHNPDGKMRKSIDAVLRSTSAR